MELTNEQKLNYYDYTVYILEEQLKCYLEDYDKNTSSTKYGALIIGKMLAYADALYSLTHDEKWNENLDELKEKIL